MYFAKNSSLDQFELYISFLDRIVSDQVKNEKYKNTFSDIFNEVYLLTSGQIDYSGVTPENFDIVTFLAYNNPELFKDLTKDKITIETYKTISDLLKANLNQLVC